jgi:hypothetical protein
MSLHIGSIVAREPELRAGRMSGEAAGLAMPKPDRPGWTTVSAVV